MHKLLLLFAYFHLITCENASNLTGKRTFFFRLNKDSNQYRVHNRVHYINPNVSDNNNYNYTYERRPAQQIKERTPFVRQEQWYPEANSTKLHLDSEWNIHLTKINKSELPLFLHQFYEAKVKDKLNTNTLRIFFNQNSNTSNIIKFDLRSLKENETILDAEMFVYIPVKNHSKMFEQSIVIRVYQFEKETENNFNESILVQNPDLHKLFNVIYISKARKGWQAFKIKKPIMNWLNGEDNFGLLLTISSYENNKLITIFNDSNIGILRTFAVVTLATETEVESNDIYFNANTTEVLETNPQCKKQEVVVDFKKIGWDKFVLYPEKVVTFDCLGKCVKIDDQTINHVKMLALTTLRKPCCVPTKYSSVPIMYYDQFNNIALKLYENAVPLECGCR